MADFFTTEVWTARGLRTFYTVFGIELHSRRVQIVGSTLHPDEAFMVRVMRLVYIKVTVSISPASFPITPPFPSGALGEGIPVYHMLLDLKVRRKSGETGTIRPYFHAAAPLKRRMIQSGVVGHEIFEGEASGQFMGKSGSEMPEALDSESRTTSMSASLGVGVGIGPVSIGASGSVRTTSTDVTSNRAVTQNVRHHHAAGLG